MSDEAAISSGQVAAVVRNYVEDFVIEYEEHLLTTLRNHHVADTLTESMLRGSVGEIVGLRRFREELESKIRRGHAALEAQKGSE